MTLTYEEYQKKNGITDPTKENYADWQHQNTVANIRNEMLDQKNQTALRNRQNQMQMNEYYAGQGLAGNINASPLSGTSETSRTNLEMERIKALSALDKQQGQLLADADQTLWGQKFAIQEEREAIARAEREAAEQRATQERLAAQELQYNRELEDKNLAMSMFSQYLNTGQTRFLTPFVKETLSKYGITDLTPNVSEQPGTGYVEKPATLSESRRMQQRVTPSAQVHDTASPLPTVAPANAREYTDASGQTLYSPTTWTQDNQVYPHGSLPMAQPRESSFNTYGTPSGLVYHGNWDYSKIHTKIINEASIADQRKLLNDFTYMAYLKQSMPNVFTNVNISLDSLAEMRARIGL